MNIPDAEKERLIEAEWEKDVLEKNTSEFFEATLNIFAENRTGLLVDISRIFTEHNIDIHSVNTRTSKQNVVTIELKFSIRSRNELAQVIAKLRSVENVIDIKRTTG